MEHEQFTGFSVKREKHSEIIVDRSFPLLGRHKLYEYCHSIISRPCRELIAKQKKRPDGHLCRFTSANKATSVVRWLTLAVGILMASYP